MTPTTALARARPNPPLTLDCRLCGPVAPILVLRVDYLERHYVSAFCPACEAMLKHGVSLDAKKTARRKALAANHVVSRDARERLLVRQGGACAEGCGQTVETGASFEVDHVIPVSVGGPDEEHNLQALCWSCHVKKSERDYRYYRERSRV